MTSRYNKFWQDRVEIIGEMLSQASRDGISKRLDISEISQIDKHLTWHGFALIKGSRVVDAPMIHMAVLADTVVREKLLIGDCNRYRFIVDDQPRLTVYRMVWRARCQTSDKKEMSALSYAQVAILEGLLPQLCAHYEGHGWFHVGDAQVWIRRQFPYIVPFTSTTEKIVEVRASNPEKCCIDIQYALYCASAYKSYWIESIQSGKRVIPLTKNPNENMVYSVKPDWQKHIPDHHRVD
ncbi:MAG: hypothetical protein KAU35_05560 [candidate division Zixibacteria bacterium]|nr:hypothetical protein [candidate division Zixibacteria bacterium]